MYNWRKMSPEMREEVLTKRKKTGTAWHGPPHFNERHLYHVSAACYDHQSIVGETPDRMTDFEALLLGTLATDTEQVLAWCLLPNHYHCLVISSAIRRTVSALGKLHGKMSFTWNGEDNIRGRKCFHRCSDREIRSERHKWATLNYIHNNPVHHGYVTKWQNWPYSSALSYIESIGLAEAEKRWRAYPVLDYGQGWDDPEL